MLSLSILCNYFDDNLQQNQAKCLEISAKLFYPYEDISYL